MTFWIIKKSEQLVLDGLDTLAHTSPRKNGFESLRHLLNHFSQTTLRQSFYRGLFTTFFAPGSIEKGGKKEWQKALR